MSAKLDDFRHIIPEETRSQFGGLVESWPKWTWDRSAWAQMGVAAVAAAMAVVLLAISFTVVVSNKADEQLPFQQAMWGLAGAFGVLMLYGLGTSLWRVVFGIASVGQWWLLLERGLVIVKNGKLQTAAPLDEIRIKTASSLTGMPQLVDGDGRSLPLPLRAEEQLVTAVQSRQRQLLRAEGEAATTKVPFALAWSEAKLFGEDRVFRIYRDGPSALVIYAGQFLPQKMGQEGFIPNAVKIATSFTPTGLVVNLAAAYGDWVVGKNFDKRAAWLDPMTLEELRVEAHNNGDSRILTASTTSDIHFGFPETKFWSNDFLQSKVTGVLTFQHQGKKWELAFFTPEEREFAKEVLVGAFGAEAVGSVFLAPSKTSATIPPQRFKFRKT